MKNRVAELLLDLGCFQIRPQQPFLYASGLSGPVYCDNRMILSDVRSREEIVGLFLEEVGHYEKKMGRVDLIAGMATAGIPFASIIAHELERPMVYVRSQSKGHGKQNLIEGKWQEGESCILIEDLVNQGKSSGQGLAALKEGGLLPKALFCIVDYQMRPAQQEVAKHGCTLHSLTDFSSLVEAAIAKKVIPSSAKKMLEEWHQHPDRDFLSLFPSI